MKGYIPAVILVFTISAVAGIAYASDVYTEKRMAMVSNDIKRRGITDQKVLDVMATVPRHLFVKESQRDAAYSDHPLPIGEGQTISQPYIVALMTEALNVKPTDKVLEIGTGSGYQAAVLGGLAKEVYSIEIRQALAASAVKRLRDLGYRNVKVTCGDGYQGWQEYAPFDAIIITAFADHVPPRLISQLREGGRLILPLGNISYYQTLTLITKRKNEIEIRKITPVSFVPMVGEVQKGK